jgi:DNA-binding NarL/FixJ family response regulator
MDLLMPRMDGVQATEAIIQSNPVARILVLTSFAEEKRIVQAIRAGALGFMLKDSSSDELVTAIREVHVGKQHFPAQFNLPNTGEEIAADTLIVQEYDILRLMAQGLSDREISQTLSIPLPDLRQHLNTILDKLDLNSRLQAALYALKIRMG